jgi:hypothetical protein
MPSSMKVHVWKPENNRWVVINVRSQELFDVTLADRGGIYVNSMRHVDYDTWNTVRKIVDRFEKESVRNTAYNWEIEL